MINHLGWSHTQSSKVFSFRFFILEDETITFPIIFNLPISYKIFTLEIFPLLLFFFLSCVLVLLSDMPSIFFPCSCKDGVAGDPSCWASVVNIGQLHIHKNRKSTCRHKPVMRTTESTPLSGRYWSVIPLCPPVQEE